MSRFESNLLQAINAEVNETRRAVLRLTWAAYRVRVGDVSAAKDVVSEVRLQYSNRYDAQIFAHVNFVEGLCGFFESGIQSALPKFVRANALSNGCPANDDLPGLVKAWLASLYRNLGNWRSMSDFLILAVNSRGSFSDEVRWRVGLVVADAFQEIESYTDAARWYARAHQYALASGDGAALSAILYNRAAIRIFNARAREVLEGRVDVSESQIALEAASAKNYTQYIRDFSMRWGFDLMAGQLHFLQGDYAQALALLDSDRVQNVGDDWPAVDLVRCADVFRCRAALGQIDSHELLSHANHVWKRSESVVGFGDKAIAAYSLSVGLEKSDVEASAVFREMAFENLNVFIEERRREAVELERFTLTCGALVNSLLPATSV